MKCKHENKKRLYARNQSSGAKAWQSTSFYLCDDCKKVVQVGFEEVKPKTMEKSISDKTKDAFCENKNKCYVCGKKHNKDSYWCSAECKKKRTSEFANCEDKK